NNRQSLDFTRPSGSPGGGAVEWLISDAPGPYLDALAAMEARAADIAALRDPRQGVRPARPPLPDVCHRARRAAHLSRAWPAGGLCDARPETAAARRPRLCGQPRRMDHPH